MGQVLLTFDVEDFISKNSIDILQLILLSLKKYEFRAIFFMTGQMAEKLKDYAEIINLLKEHEIGYHSSSHSVHPAIFEFTDEENYAKAYETSFVRESSHINPLNGQMEGKGGILAVRSIFSNKQVVSYRAPGFCWSPPHSEALRDMGIRFDFSSNMAPSPVLQKGLTFYPYPALLDWQGSRSDYKVLFSSTLRKKVAVIGLHPSSFVNCDDWDSIYKNGNPNSITYPRPRKYSEFKSMFQSFDLLLKRAKRIQKTGLIKVVPDMEMSEIDLAVTKNKVEEICECSLRWPRRVFNYNPKYLRKHFFDFFGVSF
jgi:peptidoglycan/xylan/chitin deacetylase (PgdA/CDA1 family)